MASKRIHIAVLTLLAMFEISCLNLAGGCGNEILKEVRSPSGKTKAVVFQRDCGATTGFSTQVSVLRSDQQLPNEGGNVFVADTDHGKAPSGPGGGPIVEASWTTETELLVRYDKHARFSQNQPSLANIHVRFETFAP
jgi:hypothetical protein